MTNFEDKISLMIPAYLRGELSEAENQEIETLATTNPEFAADIEFQKNLKSTISVDEDTYEPSDLGWAKLSKAIDNIEMENTNMAANDSATTPKFWRYAAMALAVAAVGQAGVLGSIALQKDQNAQYVTASDAGNAMLTLKLGLRDDLTVKQLTQTLQSLEGRVIAGPSSLGLYQIQFNSKDACLAAQNMFEKQIEFVDTMSSCE